MAKLTKEQIEAIKYMMPPEADSEHDAEDASGLPVPDDEELGDIPPDRQEDPIERENPMKSGAYDAARSVDKLLGNGTQVDKDRDEEREYATRRAKDKAFDYFESKPKQKRREA